MSLSSRTAATSASSDAKAQPIVAQPGVAWFGVVMREQYGLAASRPLPNAAPAPHAVNERPKVLVGKSVAVRTTAAPPDYFTAVHREKIGATGVVHAVVGPRGAENPLIKVKFPPDNRIVFFRLIDLEVLEQAPPEAPARHGERASHLP